MQVATFSDEQHRHPIDYRTSLTSGVLDVVDEIVKLIKAQEEFAKSEAEVFALMSSMRASDERLLAPLFESWLSQYTVKRKVHSRQKTCMLACFLWSLCFITYDAAAASLALFFGDRSTNTISRKGLARVFEHLAAYQRRRQQERDMDRFMSLAGEVFDYHEALQRTDTWRPADREFGLADSIPIDIFVRYLGKSKKLHMWPFRMVQDQIRQVLMGSAYWDTARVEYDCLFGETEGKQLDLFIVSSIVFDMHVKLRQPARRHRRKNSSHGDGQVLDIVVSPTSVSSEPQNATPAHEVGQSGIGSPLSSLTLPMGAPKAYNPDKPVPTPRPSLPDKTASTLPTDSLELENVENYDSTPLLPSWNTIPIYIDV